MPRKSDKIAINNPILDKRVKLLPQDKETIKQEYETGLYSINGLAKKWNVSKRTIQFILFPERLEKAKRQYKERRKDGRYYDREKHTEHVRIHSNYKNELYKKNIIGDDD